MREKAILNLGSGNRYLKGAVNVDFYADVADIRHDLNKLPYPFRDNTFDEIRCENILEHIDPIIPVMEELHRIARSGCLIHVRVPHFRSACLYEDLTHRHGFAWRSFDIFTGDGGVYGQYSLVRFEIVSRHYTQYFLAWPYRLLSRMPRITDNLLSKFVPMASIVFTLRVQKPG
jgi:SAM-dependent methyltransferase